MVLTRRIPHRGDAQGAEVGKCDQSDEICGRIYPIWFCICNIWFRICHICSLKRTRVQGEGLATPVMTEREVIEERESQTATIDIDANKNVPKMQSFFAIFKQPVAGAKHLVRMM